MGTESNPKPLTPKKIREKKTELEHIITAGENSAKNRIKYNHICNLYDGTDEGREVLITCLEKAVKKGKSKTARVIAAKLIRGAYYCGANETASQENVRKTAESLSQCPMKSVQVEVIPHLVSPTTLLRLSAHDSKLVRKTVARSAHLDERAQEKLAHDMCKGVRKALSSNVSISEETVLVLRQDKESEVRQRVEDSQKLS